MQRPTPPVNGPVRGITAQSLSVPDGWAMNLEFDPKARSRHAPARPEVHSTRRARQPRQCLTPPVMRQARMRRSGATHAGGVGVVRRRVLCVPSSRHFEGRGAQPSRTPIAPALLDQPPPLVNVQRPIGLRSSSREDAPGRYEDADSRPHDDVTGQECRGRRPRRPSGGS